MLSTGFIVNFAPEKWSFGHRFNNFMGPPFHVDSALRAGVASVLAHQDKYCLLVDIANEFASTLDEDEAELEASGYTPAKRARSFAALSETMVSEQYAMLDGFRKVVHSIFKTVQGTQDASTQRLFKRASDAVYGSVPAGHVGGDIFPELNARLAAADADWFPLLCQVRTLTTHGRTGNCYKDRATRRISYRYRLGAGDDIHIVDIVAWLNDTFRSVCGLTEWFFERCFAKLDPIERPVMCGIYNGRMYERFVAATARLSSDDGRCLSRGWFDTEPGCECPKRTACGAYNRPVPKQERDVHYADKKASPT